MSYDKNVINELTLTSDVYIFCFESGALFGLLIFRFHQNCILVQSVQIQRIDHCCHLIHLETLY